MQAEVISLDARRPHLSGKARCTACGHSFVAVVAIGETWFECPECHTERALLRYPVLDEPAWPNTFECGCGCDVFAIRSDSAGDVKIACLACGETQNPWASIDD